FSPSISSHLARIYKSLSSEASTAQHGPPSAAADRCGQGSELASSFASLSAFSAYMASSASDALAPVKEQDLSAPITDYYVSSSHNTYLTGNQLYSEAAASAYTHVLLNGGRCVEIDVWDGDYESSSSADLSPGDRKSFHGEKELAAKTLARLSSKLEGLMHHQTGSRERPSSNSPSSRGAAAAVAHTSDADPQIPARAEPRVLHGHTLTKSTSFRDVCCAIRDSAFVASDLPIIVSLEIHACLEQQETMVEIIKDVWQGLLVEVTPELENSTRLPSLGELKRKILLKVKSVPASIGEQAVSAAAGEPQEPNKGEPKTKEPIPGGTPIGSEAPPTAKPSKVLQALSKLAVYTKGYHFRHFAQPEAKLPTHVFSLSESATKDAHENHGEALFEHNRSFWMRVFPSGMRITSSNLDPSFCWRRGVQMAALNWQNVDKGMMLNQGMFPRKQGWVLKPPGYRSSDLSPSDLNALPIKRQTLDLSIEIFAAQKIPLPPGESNGNRFHPYVSCQLHVEQPDDTDIAAIAAANRDELSDSDNTTWKRTTKSATGTDPDFGAAKLQFPSVAGIVDALSFVRFKIKDDEIGRDALAAWACIRLDCLQQGYRLVHLWDAQGVQTDGVLLVRIEKTLS
ncbi:hypothetical protein ASPZODRAFT_30286, partial [Penicilliopsis zonata CBS 506.65]